MPSVDSGNSSILVTGGAGFIGSAVVRYLIGDTGHRVVTLDKLTYAGNTRNIAGCMGNARHKFVHGDIVDRDLVRKVLQTYEIDTVLHLAAESHVDRSIDSPGSFIETNIVGTYVLLEEFRRHVDVTAGKDARAFRFCHISTDEVFGSIDSGSFTEESPYDPSSPYSSSKAAADHLARAWARTYDLPVIVTNCSNNYGPYQHPEKLIPLTILNALEHRALPVYGDGSNVRDWLFVDDHAEALYMVMCNGRPGETYNIGSRAELSNLEVVQTICSVLDEIRPDKRSYRDLIEFVPDRPGHDHRYSVNPSKVETEIGWRSRQNFPSGIRLTIQWYLDNYDWVNGIRNSRVRRGLNVEAGNWQ